MLTTIRNMCVAIVSSALVFSTFTGDVTAKTKSLDDVTSYKVFYGEPTSRIIEEMGSYDLVIVEPIFYSPDQIKSIRSKGTKVYGYINTMEVDNWNKSFKKRLNVTDYYVRDGKRVYYKEWDSYLTDMGSSHYRKTLKGELKRQVVDKKMDGVFLDTVGNIDNEFSDDKKELARQRTGLVAFLKDVKKSYNVPMIQNWGFDTLKTSTYGIVDGIMWEDFTYARVSKDQWALDRIVDLKKIKKNYGVQVLTVSTDKSTKSIAFAKKNGFVPYTDTKGYGVWK